MRFRLITIAWVFALLASGMAAFGGRGIAAAGVLLFYWHIVARLWKQPPSAVLGLATSVVIIVTWSMTHFAGSVY